MSMNIVDILLIAGITLVLILAVRKCIRDRKQSKCCGGSCSQCGQNCGKQDPR